MNEAYSGIIIKSENTALQLNMFNYRSSMLKTVLVVVFMPEMCSLCVHFVFWCINYYYLNLNNENYDMIQK